MKKSEIENIESFKDIEMMKENLRLQIELSEERINNNIEALSEKFTIGSIASQIKESAIATLYKTFKIGYSFFSKKHNEEEE